MINKKIKTIEIIGAIAATITIICSITSIIFSYMHRDDVTTNIDEFLVKISNYYTIMRADALLSLTGGIFLILASVGFFFFFRRKLDESKKKLSLILLISISFGSLLMITISILQIYLVFYLVPNYVGVSSIVQLYFLEKAIDIINATDILSVFIHVITFTVGAGSIGILIYNKKIIHDVFVWTALTSGILSLAKIGYFLEGSIGTIFVFLASIGSIFFYFFLGEMVYVIYRDYTSENNEKQKSTIDASLLE